MSSGNVELLGDSVEILDYEAEGEAPTAEQFPAAGAGDESRPMPIVFTVDNLLANIATADSAELERAYNTGHAEAREKAEREDAEHEEEREAALAAAARKQEEEREAARAAAARKQAEERTAALAEREAYLQAARAKQGALRSRLEDLEPRHHDPRAATFPSPYPRRRIIVPPQSQSQVPVGFRSTASTHEKEREVAVTPANEKGREVAATPTNENRREGAATPEVSVALGLPVGAEDGASFAAATIGPLHALHMFLEGTRTTVGRRPLRLRAGRTTTAAPPSLREGAAPEMAGEGKSWGPSLPGLRRRATTARAGVGAQNVNSAPIIRLGVGAAGAETVVGETRLRLGIAAAGARTGAGATAGRPALTAVAAEKGDGSQATATGK
ncbi:unnamed protein product [Ectocarpus sp. CCAP 1310/34]|nr:unnamed protein product [Ectocarpus sp. CCAP 1310/34]